MCDDDTDTDNPIHIKPTDPLYQNIKQFIEEQKRIIGKEVFFLNFLSNKLSN